MVERLFVYGSLGPGRPNEHVLAVIGGNWQVAGVMGTLRHEGWGAAMGGKTWTPAFDVLFRRRGDKRE